MGAFFVYIVKSAVCLAVFYLFYRLLLSRETFHRFNRIALLGILILSCAIPFVEVTMKEPMEVSQQLLTWEELLLMANLNRTATIETAPESAIMWREALLMVYLLGIVFFFLRNVWSLTRMLRLIKGSTLVRQENGITLITHQKEIAPFSWMKFVVISEKDLKENGEEILTHEYAHIRKRHSIDLLIADICIFFQWFNPASWLLKQELQNIHEFEADESVIAQGIDAKKYQLLLIKKAVGTRLYSMANSFNHSSLKKRITMMLKKKSNPWARLKYLYVLPLAVIAVAAFARPEISSELDEISAVKVNDLTAIMKTEEVKSPEKHPAKEIKVQGQVLEKSTNAPVVGANVIIKGTTSGTITDLDGNFVISMPVGATLSVSYINMKTNILVKCPNGHKSYFTNFDRFKRGDRCPYCNESKGEKKINEILNKYNMNFKSQYKFNNCKSKRELPFDFYISDLNIAIEYDGIQHYKIIEYFSGLDGFITTKIHDVIKTRYCEDNNIKLIRIPYWEYDDIESILIKELNLK